MTEQPAWLAERKRAALETFASLEWPGQDFEEWKHTDLGAFEPDRFNPADPVLNLVIPEQPGLTVIPFAEADQGFVEELTGRTAVPDHEAKFAAWNEAFASGLIVHVARGVHVAEPVRVGPHIKRPGDAIFPRLIVLADEDSSVTVVDGYADPPTMRGAEGACVAGVELIAEQAATINYICVQDHPQTVYHFSLLRALVGRDATIRSLVATLGARLSRSVSRAILEGQGAHAELLGVSFGDHEQHIDNRTLQLHRGPHTSSEVYYKGALKGRARSVYSGLVDLEKDALQSDAQQSNRNLMLSEHAHADATPFLEIKTSEVARATHGVSVGRPDAEVLFYLRSRGLDPVEAERVFVKGFFQELIDRISDPVVGQTLEAAVEAELDLEDEA